MESASFRFLAPNAEIELFVLGPLEVRTGGERASLPRSKKTRALLAYLAATGRPHRRDRLCALLWDVTDDPRGALRWSLSRLRNVFPDGKERIQANREEVTFRTDGMRVDAHELSSVIRSGLGDASTEELERLASLPRGEFLEGLDLPDFMDFNAWCVAERERFREEHCAVLAELGSRLSADPQRALPFARQRAQADAFSVPAQTELFRLLLAANKRDEARQRYENSARLYKEVGAAGLFQLDQAWRELSTSDPSAPAPQPAPKRTAPRMAPPVTERAVAQGVFVGREREISSLGSWLEASRSDSAPRVALVTGEPGSGKSRLAERLVNVASDAGFAVLSGKAYEGESTRPYGPWAEMLAVDIQELLPGGPEGDSVGSRDTLFAAIVQRLQERARDQGGVMLLLDDLQWLDSDSSELLHYVARTHRGGPLFILLLARGGELADNEAGLRALRSLRRENRVDELSLDPLSLEDIGELIAAHGDVDVKRIYEASAGNPLYAIELARAHEDGGDEAPPTLLQLVRERIEHLPDHAADVLRWGAILGHAIDVERLEALSSLELDDLVDALERLEQNALLRVDTSKAKQRYVFSHDVVREAVYGELSHPRRRLMHRKVAHLLEPRISDVAIATDVAHHAGLAGEAILGVRACVVAGTQSLRVFANGDAEALSKRGLRLVEELEDETDRITSTLDLLRVQYAARTPNREAAAKRVRELAEQALDMGLTREARLGFQMLSFLRWESSSMADAHANIMQAERVSRSADPDERTAALAQAAKCLVLLERNLGQAEAFVMEACALTNRAGNSSSSVSFASGMIAAHRGEIDAAVDAFREARELAREHGERLAEFCAIEHWVMLEIDRGTHEDAVDLAESLAELGGKVRPGAEVHAGRALLAFVRLLCDKPQAEEALRSAIDDLNTADAKYELSFLMTRWAAFELERGRLEEAKQHAEAALDVARAIGRPSETALAHAVLAECAAKADDCTLRDQHLAKLEGLNLSELSKAARDRVESVLAAPAKRKAKRRR